MSHADTGTVSPTSHKSPKSLAFARGSGLASGTVVVVCALAGCLVPQSVDPIPTVPHPPPHFVLESIRPELLAPIVELYRQGSADASQVPACHCELELSIPFVEEDDPTVVLLARWFVDYDPNVPTSVVVRRTDTLDQGFDNPSTIRTLGAWQFDADAVGINTSGTHVISVIVGEKAGFDDRPDAPLPNRTMFNGYAYAEHSFTVNVVVQQDPSRPTCPSQFPSVKVCQ